MAETEAPPAAVVPAEEQEQHQENVMVDPAVWKTLYCYRISSAGLIGATD